MQTLLDQSSSNLQQPSVLEVLFRNQPPLGKNVNKNFYKNYGTWLRKIGRDSEEIKYRTPFLSIAAQLHQLVLLQLMYYQNSHVRMYVSLPFACHAIVDFS